MALLALAIAALAAAAVDQTCPSTNSALVLKQRPEAGVHISPSHFELVELPKPAELGEGKVLVRNLYASLDPTHRIWATDDAQYMPPASLGKPMRAATIGVVEQSNEPSLPVGSHVVGIGGLQQYYVTSAAEGAADVGEDMPLTAHLSVLSFIIGLTAWVGTYDILDVQAGDTVVISGGAGAVGSLAGQLAKLRGARVIGIVGSDAKAQWLTSELGFDGAVSYKDGEVALVAALRAAAPNGVDKYFDNTGGVSTEAVLKAMNNGARIALCGVISGYNSGEMGLSNYQMLLHRRVKVEGFICTDHFSKC
ncbi:hypothetical protein T492DRAFT_1008468, partial [Pavlovales sp. CCMP2436]